MSPVSLDSLFASLDTTLSDPSAADEAMTSASCAAQDGTPLVQDTGSLRVCVLEQAIDRQFCRKLENYSSVPASLLLKAPQRLLTMVDHCFDTSRQLMRIPPTEPLSFQAAPFSRYIGAAFACDSSRETSDDECSDRRDTKRLNLLDAQQSIASAIVRTSRSMQMQLAPALDEGRAYEAGFARKILRGFLSISPAPSPELSSKTDLLAISWAAAYLGADLVISPNYLTLALLRSRLEPSLDA